jgi:hypothetical protein
LILQRWNLRYAVSSLGGTGSAEAANQQPQAGGQTQRRESALKVMPGSMQQISRMGGVDNLAADCSRRHYRIQSWADLDQTTPVCRICSPLLPLLAAEIIALTDKLRQYTQ